jgi:hypothetical protein
MYDCEIAVPQKATQQMKFLLESEMFRTGYRIYFSRDKD